MTDPLSQIKSAVSAETDTLKGVAKQFEVKQAGWAKRNLVPLLIGLALGLLVGYFTHL